MTERERLLQAIVNITEDYQAGSLPPLTTDHVNCWIDQFPTSAQQPILAETAHVLTKTYFSKRRVKSFIKDVIHHDRWTENDPSTFWKGVDFLNIQPRGNSQRELLKIFDKKLMKECGFSISGCGNGQKFLYLDDGLFSGGRIGADVEGWIRGSAPQDAQLYIAVIALHTQGLFFTKRSFERAISETGKKIKIRWVRSEKIEDGLYSTNSSDVLRPTGPGTDPTVAAYIETLGRNPVWRTGTDIGPNQYFSSNVGREVLEQEYLRKGVFIRSICPHLNDYQRPLGNTTMRTVGFGTMFVTYRNCPNNAPLVLWAGDPWYPLFRRITN